MSQPYPEIPPDSNQSNPSNTTHSQKDSTTTTKENKIHITQAATPSEIATARTLIKEYTDWLNLDLTFQSLESELADLPGKYSSEQGGCLLLAWSGPDTDADVEVLGMIALRFLSLSIVPPSIPHSNESNTANEEFTSHSVTTIIPKPSPSPPLPTSLTPTSAPSRNQKPEATYAELKRLYTLPASRGKGVGKLLITTALTHAKDLGYDFVLLDTLPRMKEARALYEKLGFRECGPYYQTPICGTSFWCFELEEL